MNVISDQTGVKLFEFAALLGALRAVERDSQEDVNNYTKLLAVYGFFTVLKVNLIKVRNQLAIFQLH